MNEAQIIQFILSKMKEKKIKQKELYEKLNLSQSYVSELLNMKKQLTLNQFITICEHLDLDISLIDKNR